MFIINEKGIKRINYSLMFCYPTATLFLKLYVFRYSMKKEC